MVKTSIITVLEALAVVAVGWGIGLTANAMNDKPLALGKDHLRATVKVTPAPTNRTPEPLAGVIDGDETATEPELTDEGFQLISHEEAIEVYQGHAYAEEREVFIDARDDKSYAEYHIPGAFQLDHYYAERYLDDVLPACRNAERIILYCNGGKCEDSKLAAGDLMDNGIDPAKLFIYNGGITQWTADGLPCERGERLSNDIVYPNEQG
ncbi:MAG: rhodanese-like domain-containing protein [FCB group bacterium]|jgi:rhodanese-related sulfurtransferase|nr:rhodanese-like domain-containing protein [FCB group bacterium]